MKSQPVRWEKIKFCYISEWGLMYKIHTELKQLGIKKMKIKMSNLKWAKDLSGNF